MVGTCPRLDQIRRLCLLPSSLGMNGATTSTPLVEGHPVDLDFEVHLLSVSALIALTLTHLVSHFTSHLAPSVEGHLRLPSRPRPIFLSETRPPVAWSLVAALPRVPPLHRQGMISVRPKDPALTDPRLSALCPISDGRMRQSRPCVPQWGIPTDHQALTTTHVPHYFGLRYLSILSSFT